MLRCHLVLLSARLEGVYSDVFERKYMKKTGQDEEQQVFQSGQTRAQRPVVSQQGHAYPGIATPPAPAPNKFELP